MPVFQADGTNNQINTVHIRGAGGFEVCNSGVFGGTSAYVTNDEAEMMWIGNVKQ